MAALSSGNLSSRVPIITAERRKFCKTALESRLMFQGKCLKTVINGTVDGSGSDYRGVASSEPKQQFEIDVLKG